MEKFNGKSIATSVGYYKIVENLEHGSIAACTGYDSAALNAGYNSAALNVGPYSQAVTEGQESVAIAIGYQSKARGALNCWIVLAEWDVINDESHIVDVKSAKVDGVNIKANTCYMLKNGKFIEVD